MTATVESDAPVLEVSGLRKSFGSVAAVRDIQFAVPRGSFYGLFGRNGSGKTTSFDMITGLLGRDAGVIRMFGEDVGAEPSVAAKDRIAYVGGHILLYDWMSLTDHLGYVAGFYSSWDDSRAAELVELFDLPMKQRVGTLSPGQHLQFQLIMALAHRPELLIMDEPGNLDVVVRSQLMDTLISILQARESTVLMASHLINELEGVCDYMCIIDRGVTVTAGAVRGLVEQAGQAHLRGVTQPDSVLEHLVPQGVWHKRLAANEIKLVMPRFDAEVAESVAKELGADGFEVGPVSLEEFFVALISEREG